LDLIEKPPPFDANDREQKSAMVEGPISFPERRRLLILATIGGIIGGFSSLFAGVIQSRATIDPRNHAAAKWMADYADERGWEFPESYVFNEWGRNRMYNYFVNGESRSYGYAQSNYESFITETDPDEATAMVDGRARFIVTQSADSPRRVMHARLHRHHGSQTGDLEGLGRFRAVFSTPDGSRKAFVLVPGATVHGTASASGANAANRGQVTRNASASATATAFAPTRTIGPYASSACRITGFRSTNPIDSP
jgi:hypothetical protein